MSLTDDKRTITETYFALININNIELFGVIKNNLDATGQILPLIEFIIERLNTVTSLTINDSLWDAEIVLRSAQETFIKFLFITTADKVEQQKRLHEFWYDLAEVNSIKQSEQAKKNLKHLGDSETHRLAYQPNVLTEEQEQFLRSKWTRVERKKLEQKWSFSGIIASLSKNYKGSPAEMFVTLGHCYRMASHVTHGDETGILIISERNSRTQEEQDKVNFAHYLRLLSDAHTYCLVVAIETMSFLNLDKSSFIKNTEGLKEVQELIDKYHAAVFDDKDYDMYRQSEEKQQPT